jgi:hypothetical protein
MSKSTRLPASAQAMFGARPPALPALLEQLTKALAA